jgi:polysaccharide export outer membrane protein
MRSFSILALLTLALCAAFVCPAQEKAPARPSGPEPIKGQLTEPMAPLNNAAGASVDPNTYRLGADDVVGVRVWREPDLSGQISIRPDGKITMPLVNEIKAADLTPSQLGEAIAAALSKFVNNPQVTVTVLSVRSKRYFISGEVSRPGAYPLATPITVFDALVMAGGFREFAGTKKITIMRGTQRFRFNWNEVVKGKNLSQNIFLENGDRVIVP